MNIAEIAQQHGITADEVHLLVGLIGKLEQNITELQNK